MESSKSKLFALSCIVLVSVIFGSCGKAWGLASNEIRKPVPYSEFQCPKTPRDARKAAASDFFAFKKSTPAFTWSAFHQSARVKFAECPESLFRIYLTEAKRLNARQEEKVFGKRYEPERLPGHKTKRTQTPHR